MKPTFIIMSIGTIFIPCLFVLLLYNNSIVNMIGVVYGLILAYMLVKTKVGKKVMRAYLYFCITLNYLDEKII